MATMARTRAPTSAASSRGLAAPAPLRVSSLLPRRRGPPPPAAAAMTSFKPAFKSAPTFQDKSPSPDFVEAEGAKGWEVWTSTSVLGDSGVGEFHWEWKMDEKAFVLEGDAFIYPDDGQPTIHLEAGDYFYFPKGMTAKWEVKKLINKHILNLPDA